MSYSKSILGNNLFNLTYLDIENFFIEEREENLNLEFKSYVDEGSFKEKEKVIFKSICALLNSEGGIIIWGAPIEIRDSSQNTKAIGTLTPFNVGMDKDKLINKISSNIIPLPINFKVQFLTNDDGNSIIVIEVNKSIERPHQFSNNYYIRLDGQTRIAPHYLIKALIKSKDFPILRGHVRLKEIFNENNYLKLIFRKLIYNATPYQNEIKPYYKLVVQPPGELFINGQSYGNHTDDEFSILANGRPEMFDFEVRLDKNSVNDNLDIILQIGGQKSPSKLSIYTYNFKNAVAGKVNNEEIFLVEKEENQLPTDYPDRTDDDKIETLLLM